LGVLDLRVSKPCGAVIDPPREEASPFLIEEKHLVFVYGSLRRGHSNHREMAGAALVRADARLVGYRRVLYDSGYPAIHWRAGEEVTGELYEVDAAHLERLDEFEGCPEWYQRRDVVLVSGERAFAYVVSSERGELLPDFPEAT
jgi:gamma-glutamylcyclotransferase (GGCT)/AIG2-like uncharacterized protein YtfP